MSDLVIEHAPDCQLERLDKELKRLDEGQELCEMDEPLRRFARECRMVPNAKGEYDYCTCRSGKAK